MIDLKTREEILFSEREAARLLGVSRITVLRMRQQGRIGFYRIGTRVLFDRNHIAEFKSVCENKATESKAAAA